jgi:hypothetical protein
MSGITLDWTDSPIVSWSETIPHHAQVDKVSSAGYPLIVHLSQKETSTLGGYNLGGINATGQVPEIPGNYGLIDKDTPPEAYTHTSFEDGTEWDLVFSDEFNVDGRTFYPGDDPYWEALDIHYW